jgi:hypothetical protein
MPYLYVLYAILYILYAVLYVLYTLLYLYIRVYLGIFYTFWHNPTYIVFGSETNAIARVMTCWARDLDFWNTFLSRYRKHTLISLFQGLILTFSFPATQIIGTITALELCYSSHSQNSLIWLRILAITNSETSVL